MMNEQKTKQQIEREIINNVAKKRLVILAVIRAEIAKSKAKR